jgi:hypothetical protein
MGLMGIDLPRGNGIDESERRRPMPKESKCVANENK